MRCQEKDCVLDLCNKTLSHRNTRVLTVHCNSLYHAFSKTSPDLSSSCIATLCLHDACGPHSYVFANFLRQTPSNPVFSPKPPGNFLRHREHPNSALWPFNPHSFRDAGISEEVHSKAALNISGIVLRLDSKRTPFQRAFNACTRGFRKEFKFFGSFPIAGMIPTTRTFSHLKRSARGTVAAPGGGKGGQMPPQNYFLPPPPFCPPSS